MGTGPGQVGREEGRSDRRSQACAGDSVSELEVQGPWCQPRGEAWGGRRPHGGQPLWGEWARGGGLPSPRPHQSCKGPAQQAGRGGSLSSFAEQLRLKVKSERSIQTLGLTSRPCWGMRKERSGGGVWPSLTISQRQGLPSVSHLLKITSTRNPYGTLSNRQYFK